MKDFESWYKELKSEAVWWTNACLNHSPETVNKVANAVYMVGMTNPSEFSVTPFAEHRRHFFYKLSKITPDIVRKPWFEKAYEKALEQPKPEDVPLTGEARAKKLKEWKEQLESVKVYAPPKLTSEQIKEEGDWIAKKVPPHPSTTAEEVAKRIIHSEYLKANYNIVTGEPLAEWMPENQWIELQSL